MKSTPDQLLDRLAGLGIETETHDHPPLRTVEDSKALRGSLPGGHCKNLFLKDKKGQVWLVVADEDRDIDMKRLRRQIGAGGTLSFGKPDLLEELLGVQPGAVTPFGLINDREHRVRVVLDKGMMMHDLLNYHPLTNDRTTAIRSADLLRFIEACGHAPAIVDLEAEPEETPTAQ
jgi:Ala-tRNA(Pro) deacylase